MSAIDPTTTDRIDDLCRELGRGADPRRTQFIVLEIKDSLTDIYAALRGDESDFGIIGRTMAELCIGEASEVIRTLWLTIREKRPREPANEALSLFVGKVGATTAYYRSRGLSLPDDSWVQ